MFWKKKMEVKELRFTFLAGSCGALWLAHTNGEWCWDHKWWADMMWMWTGTIPVTLPAWTAFLQAQEDLEGQPRWLIPVQRRHISEQNLEKAVLRLCSKHGSICPEHLGQHLPAISERLTGDGALNCSGQLEQPFQSAGLHDKSFNHWRKQRGIKIALNTRNTVQHLVTRVTISPEIFLKEWDLWCCVWETLAGGLNSRGNN